jgi:hypothetical protein
MNGKAEWLLLFLTVSKYALLLTCYSESVYHLEVVFIYNIGMLCSISAMLISTDKICTRATRVYLNCGTERDFYVGISDPLQTLLNRVVHRI